MKNYYKILGLLDSASTDEIRRAYRILARRYHPDLNPGKDTSARFQEITESYEVLSDPKKRKRYDSDFEASRIKAAKEKFEGAQRRSHVGGQSSGGFHFGKVSAHGPRERVSREQDYRVLPQPFWKDVAAGFKSVSRDVKEWFKKQKTAVKNSFPGKTAAAKPKKPTILKVSVVEVSIKVEDAIKGIRRKVEINDGKKIRNVSVNIPAGMRSGSVLRLRNRTDGQEDLIVIIRLASHPFLSLETRGLVVEIPVSVNEALYGCQISVPGLDDEVLIKIPPGSQSGDEIRVLQKGIQSSNGQRGDIFYKLMIKVPESPNAVGLKDKAAKLEEYYGSSVRSSFPKTLV